MNYKSKALKLLAPFGMANFNELNMIMACFNMAEQIATGLRYEPTDDFIENLRFQRAAQTIEDEFFRYCARLIRLELEGAVNFRNSQGETVAHIIAQHLGENDWRKNLKKLKDFGLDMTIKDFTGNSVVDYLRQAFGEAENAFIDELLWNEKIIDNNIISYTDDNVIG